MPAERYPMSEQEKLEELERELLEAMRKVSQLDEAVARQRAIVQASRLTHAAPDAPCWSCCRSGRGIMPIALQGQVASANCA